MNLEGAPSTVNSILSPFVLLALVSQHPSEVTVYVRDDDWTVRAKLEHVTGDYAITIPVQGARVTARIIGQEVLDEIAHSNAPRFEIYDARDPCLRNGLLSDPTDRPSRVWWPRTKTPEVKNAKVEVVASPKKGHQLVRVFGPSPGKRFWTPSVRIETSAKAIDLRPLSGGRPVRTEIFTQHHRPLGQTVRLPGRIDVPEVTLDDPTDFYRATVSNTMRKSPGAFIQVSDQRFVARGTDILRLRIGPHHQPEDTRWRIRRVWRAPLTCDPGRYLTNVKKQQSFELVTYSNLTGRPMKWIRKKSEGAGFALQGTDLRPIDRSAVPPEAP